MQVIIVAIPEKGKEKPVGTRNIHERTIAKGYIINHNNTNYRIDELEWINKPKVIKAVVTQFPNVVPAEVPQL